VKITIIIINTTTDEVLLLLLFYSLIFDHTFSLSIYILIYANVEVLRVKSKSYDDDDGGTITQRLLSNNKGRATDKSDQSYRTEDSSSMGDHHADALSPVKDIFVDDEAKWQVLSEDEHDGESDGDSKKTPWLAFFTTPSSLTLLLGSWTNVSWSTYINFYIFI